MVRCGKIMRNFHLLGWKSYLQYCKRYTKINILLYSPAYFQKLIEKTSHLTFHKNYMNTKLEENHSGIKEIPLSRESVRTRIKSSPDDFSLRVKVITKKSSPSRNTFGHQFLDDVCEGLWKKGGGGG
jgi:hypothetical protein